MALPGYGQPVALVIEQGADSPAFVVDLCGGENREHRAALAMKELTLAVCVPAQILLEFVAYFLDGGIDDAAHLAVVRSTQAGPAFGGLAAVWNLTGKGALYVPDMFRF